MSNWFYKHHGFGEPPYETYSSQDIWEAPPEQQERERKALLAEQRWIKKLQRKEEERLQKEEEEAQKHLEETFDQMRVDITQDVTEELLRKQEEEKYYRQQPTWYLFEDTDTGEQVSIALTRAEKEVYRKDNPNLEKIGVGGKNHQWGYRAVRKIRTRHDDLIKRDEELAKQRGEEYAKYEKAQQKVTEPDKNPVEMIDFLVFILNCFIGFNFFILMGMEHATKAILLVPVLIFYIIAAWFLRDFFLGIVGATVFSIFFWAVIFVAFTLKSILIIAAFITSITVLHFLTNRVKGYLYKKYLSVNI